MNHSTIIDECRDHRSIQAETIRELQQLSLLHIDSAAYFVHPSSMHVFILFSDRALDYMLKAVYMKEYNCQVAPASLSHHDVMQLTAAESIPHLDMVTFILNIHYLASCKDISLLQQMQTSHLKKLLNRVEDVLAHLSARVTPHISHQSIR